MKSQISFKNSLLTGLKTAVVASVINVILFHIFHYFGIITDDIMIQPDTSLSAMPIIMSATIPTLLASIVFFFLNKYTTNGFKIFRVIAIILLILSFMPPFFGIPNVTIPYAIALNTMHVVVVGVLLYFLNSLNKTSA